MKIFKKLTKGGSWSSIYPAEGFLFQVGLFEAITPPIPFGDQKGGKKKLFYLVKRQFFKSHTVLQGMQKLLLLFLMLPSR